MLQCFEGDFALEAAACNGPFLRYSPQGRSPWELVCCTMPLDQCMIRRGSGCSCPAADAGNHEFPQWLENGAYLRSLADVQFA